MSTTEQQTSVSSDVTPENAAEVVAAVAEPPPEDAGYDAYINYFNQSAAGIKTLLFGKDARTTAAILQARLVNMRRDYARYGKVPVVGKFVQNFLGSKIRVMEAEYRAAALQAKEEQYAANTRLAFNAIGVGVGTLTLFAIIQYVAYLRARTKAISG